MKFTHQSGALSKAGDQGGMAKVVATNRQAWLKVMLEQIVRLSLGSSFGVPLKTTSMWTVVCGDHVSKYRGFDLVSLFASVMICCVASLK